MEPFISEEAIRSNQAARIAGVTQRTIINWCEEFGLGRKIGERWIVSRAGLQMHMEGNKAALERYLGGDRKDPLVTQFFRRLGMPFSTVPRP